MTWDPVIRKSTYKLRIAKERSMPCSRPGCRNEVVFECAYTYKTKGGRVRRACLLYCEEHTRQFAIDHKLDICAEYIINEGVKSP